MDIRPPKRPVQAPTTDPVERVLPPVAPLDPHAQAPTSGRSKPSKRRIFTVISSLLVALLAAVALSTVAWYTWATSPVSDEPSSVRVVIEPGDTAVIIAEKLDDQELIRSKLAFSIYTQLSGTRHKLQAGGYVLSADQGVASIVEHMTSGKTDEFNITILPGLTLGELRERFKQDGFTDAEIDAAYEASYDHPLLASRPVGASLEGYLYPETYRMGADQTLQELFERSFDEMYEMLKRKGYLAEYQKRGLSIHQAVILASIVQKEVMDPADQKQVAQVFLKRYNEGIQLGSDVTYMYAAKQTGQEATPSLESPYNTRKYVGLPPGPIANMNPSALEAVALPAPGDYLYFVAGDGADEGKTFFARTEAEHNANIKAHCHILCR